MVPLFRCFCPFAFPHMFRLSTLSLLHFLARHPCIYDFPLFAASPCAHLQYMCDFRLFTTLQCARRYNIHDFATCTTSCYSRLYWKYETCSASLPVRPCNILRPYNLHDFTPFATLYVARLNKMCDLLLPATVLELTTP